MDCDKEELSYTKALTIEEKKEIINSIKYIEEEKNNYIVPNSYFDFYLKKILNYVRKNIDYYF
jgi:hypothetical protein